MVIVRPATQPSSPKRCSKAASGWLHADGEFVPRKLMTRAFACWARAASGHAAAVVAKSVMNSRRCICRASYQASVGSDMGRSGKPGNQPARPAPDFAALNPGYRCTRRGSPHSLDCLSIGIDQIAGLELRGPDHDLARHVLELADVVAADVLALCVDDTRRLPFAVLAERHRPHHRVDGMVADVVVERLVIERFDLSGRLGEDLSGGVGIRRIGEAERIDAQPRRPLLVLVQELPGAGELQAGGRNVELVVDESVGQRTELLLDYGHQEAEKGPPVHLRPAPPLLRPP